MMSNLLARICIVATCAMVVVAAPPLVSPSTAGAPLGSAPISAPLADCSSLIYDLMDCMEFLVAGGNDTMPDKSCCLGFKSLMEANEDCMCYALDTSATLGLEINMTRAKALPAQCRVKSPPITTCHVSSPPSGSPANSPIPPPAAAPGSAPSLPPSAASPAPTVGPVRAPVVSPRAPTVAPSSVVNGPVAADLEQAKSGACVISPNFSAFLLVIIFFLF